MLRERIIKNLFFSDSITDAIRNRACPESIVGLEVGYVRVVADRLIGKTLIDDEWLKVFEKILIEK